jgi:hypothetical protein
MAIALKPGIYGVIPALRRKMLKALSQHSCMQYAVSEPYGDCPADAI